MAGSARENTTDELARLPATRTSPGPRWRWRSARRFCVSLAGRSVGGVGRGSDELSEASSASGRFYEIGVVLPTNATCTG
jgi:hypothetical protein